MRILTVAFGGFAEAVRRRPPASRALRAGDRRDRDHGSRKRGDEEAATHETPTLCLIGRSARPASGHQTAAHGPHRDHEQGRTDRQQPARCSRTIGSGPVASPRVTSTRW